MLTFSKPQKQDLPSVAKILAQWNDEVEAQKYVDRVRQEIQGKTKYEMHFWVLKLDGKVIGLGGLSNCQPKLTPFITSCGAKELKAIYLDEVVRGKGYGRQLINYLEQEARSQGCDQLVLVSAIKYRDTAYGFYKKMGFEQQGYVPGGEPEKQMVVFAK